MRFLGWYALLGCFTKAVQGLAGEFPYPIIADPKRELAVKLGMLDPVEKDSAGMPLTARAVCWVEEVCVYVCMYVCMYVWLYVCMVVCMYVYL